MGTLIVSGILRVSQFWPQGRSDADTASIELTIQGKKSFVFVDDAGKQRTTNAFDNAEIIGQHGRSPVIKKSKKSATRKITIRLQGLDAPELHYQPQVAGAGGKGILHPFRQSLGETCANALHEYVASFEEPEVPCEAVTIVKHPNDVCDVYGRVVANVVVIRGGARIDLNHWLLREGWALPGLYNSMSKAEIRAVLTDHKAAKQVGRGLFSNDIVTTELAPFDPLRVERKGPPSFQPFSDLGPVNFPKYFRRQAEQYVSREVDPTVSSDLVEFIANKSTDLALETDIFLKLKGSTVGNKPRPEFQQLATLLTGNRFPTGPEVVYWENESTLVKAGTKTPINKW